MLSPLHPSLSGVLPGDILLQYSLLFILPKLLPAHPSICVHTFLLKTHVIVQYVRKTVLAFLI